MFCILGLFAFFIEIRSIESRMQHEDFSPFLAIAADRLALAVNKLVAQGRLDARSEVADRLLDYASGRFGDSNPIGDLEAKREEYDKKFRRP